MVWNIIDHRWRRSAVFSSVLQVGRPRLLPPVRVKGQSTCSTYVSAAISTWPFLGCIKEQEQSFGTKVPIEFEHPVDLGVSRSCRPCDRSRLMSRTVSWPSISAQPEKATVFKEYSRFVVRGGVYLSYQFGSVAWPAATGCTTDVEQHTDREWRISRTS